LAKSAIKNCPERRLVPSSSKLPYAEAINYATFSDFILAHARVYVFADCYGIVDLAKEALYNVHHNPGTRNAFLDDMEMIITFCATRILPPALRDVLVTYIAIMAFSAWHDFRIQSLLKSSELEHEVLGMIIKAATSQTPSIAMGTCSSGSIMNGSRGTCGLRKTLGEMSVHKQDFHRDCILSICGHHASFSSLLHRLIAFQISLL
jgi:hypothetical protein